MCEDETKELAEMINRKTLIGLAWMVAVALTTVTLHAQEAPPQPQLNTVPSPLAGYGLMFVLAILVVAISLYPSKRSHTD